MRWRIEKEVIIGKGETICGNKSCDKASDLETFEVNFAYAEGNERKNALVKVRVCVACAEKLNFHHEHKKIKN